MPRKLVQKYAQEVSQNARTKLCICWFKYTYVCSCVWSIIGHFLYQEYVKIKVYKHLRHDTRWLQKEWQIKIQNNKQEQHNKKTIHTVFINKTKSTISTILHVKPWYSSHQMYNNQAMFWTLKMSILMT